jgi:hypothetical protein
LDEITVREKFVSLTVFIQKSNWSYAALDIVNKWEIKSLATEDFWHFVGGSERPLEEPGHLSAVTVAKVIEYGVDLVGGFTEGNFSNLSLFSSEDFPACVIR